MTHDDRRAPTSPSLPPADAASEVWKWLRGAPLPVVLAITLALGSWVYTIAADVEVEKARSEGMRQTVDKIDEKLDKLLEAVAELKAEQKARDREARRPATPPSPPANPPKEK